MEPSPAAENASEANSENFRVLRIVAAVAIGLAAVIVLFLSIRITSAADNLRELAQYQQAASLVVTALGSLLAVAAGLALLLSAILGGPLRRLVALSIPLMGGLLMVNVHWSLGLALGATVVAVAMLEMLGTRKGTQA